MRLLVFSLLAGALVLVPLDVRDASKPEVAEAQVLFGGDAMFDRYIRDVAARRGGDYLFSCVRDELAKADLTAVNLEGPITAHESVSQGTTDGEVGHYQFTFPLSTAALLSEHTIRAVNIGNNHILNFGLDGLLETKAALDYAGVAYFGDPDRSERERVWRTEVEGVPLSFVNWSDWTSESAEQTVAQIQEERASGRLPIVYAHWGDEYVGAPERTKVLARRFVDAGAVLIIGSHSHIEGEHELYKGREIYYSLGNFIFDQYFSDAVRSGSMVRAYIRSDGIVRTERVPLLLETDGRTCVRLGEEE